MKDTTNVIKYNSRTFGEIRDDIVQMIRKSYPELINDFTDSNVGSMLIDINAGVGNNLAINTDRVFQETQLEYAQRRSSIFNIAKNLGFKIPPNRPSVTVVDFTVTVPVRGDAPNADYYPVLQAGAVVTGGGKSFETQDAINWNSPVSLLGDANRSIIPNLDSNGIIQSYEVTKREVVINGSSKIYKRVINENDVRPFFSITLPDPNVINIESIILKEGTNYDVNPTDSEFFRNDFENGSVNDENTNVLRFYEVDYLAQQRIFVENGGNINQGIKIGNWVEVRRKFIKEFTQNGFCRVTFGSGDPDIDVFKDGFLRVGVSNRYFLENFLNNTALGERLRSGFTLFIKYRVGGGSNSNVGTGVLNDVSVFNLVVTGPRQEINQSVRRSLRVDNPIPAIGGNDGLSTEQIRQLIKYNYSSQYRDVVLNDYLLQVFKMPGRFGSPFRANAERVNNKIVISILGIGSDGKLSNTSNSILKENIAEYLTEFRMVNDYVEIADGKIFNLAFDIELFVNDVSDALISNNVINVIREHLNINTNDMNQNLYIGRLEKKILEVNGVINILSIKVFNKFGGQYSQNVISQDLINENTGEIRLIDNTVYANKDSMFEIKFPQRDIRVFLRKTAG